MNEPGTSKGGQVVIINDDNRTRLQSYINKHTLHEMPDGWNFKGQYEVRYIIEQLAPLAEGEPAGPEERKIFKEKFHSTWDIFFSCDVIMDWIGERGFEATMTCRRDCLPFGVPGQYS